MTTIGVLKIGQRVDVISMHVIDICFEKIERDVVVVRLMPAGINWVDVVDVLGIPDVVSFTVSDVKSDKESDIERYGIVGRDKYVVTGTRLFVHHNSTRLFFQTMAQIVHVVATRCGVDLPVPVVRYECEYAVHKARYELYVNTVTGLIPFTDKPPTVTLDGVWVTGVKPVYRYHIGVL